jgi:hypothetical protein
LQQPFGWLYALQRPAVSAQITLYYKNYNAMKKCFFTLGLLLALVSQSGAQVAVNANSTPPHSSAMLDVSSTGKGILVPRMSTAQRNAIAAPATGLLVYDSTVHQFIFYNGTAWAAIPNGPGGTGSWTVNGNNQYSAVSGNVGIGTTAPADKLHIVGNLRIDGGKISFTNTGSSVFIGDNAGLNDDLTSNANTFVGHNSGRSNSTGDANSFLGYNAGLSNTTGGWNASFGYNSLSANTTGALNTAVGKDALSLNTINSDNTALGARALRDNKGDNNVAIGSRALLSAISVSNTVAIGKEAGLNNLSGTGNVFLGHNVGANETGSHKLYIDNSSTSLPLIYGNFAADSLKINGTLTVNNAYTFPSTAGTANYVLQTNGTGQAAWVNPSALPIAETDPQVSSTTLNYIPKWNGTALVDGQLFDNGSVGIGTTSPLGKLDVTVGNGKYYVPSFNTSGGTVLLGIYEGTAVAPQLRFAGAGPDFVDIGQDSSGNFTVEQGDVSMLTITPAGNVGIGNISPSSKLHVKGNVKLDGTRLAFVNTGNSVFIGENAGAADDLTDNQNVFIGYKAGELNTSGAGNTFIGSFSGSRTTTGTLNTGVGISALDNNTTGFSNVALGRSALSANTTGGNNLALGTGALQFKATGNSNIALGTNAMRDLTNGNYNVAIGHDAGFRNTGGSGNIFLGFDAGYNETGSDKLYIDNSTTTTPLVYGNFAADSLKINGTLTVNNAYTFPSTAGTANQVLQTNGAGQAAWVNPTSLSITESDPKVGSLAINYLPKWNGTSLVIGQIFDNGTAVGIGTTSPAARLSNTAVNVAGSDGNGVSSNAFLWTSNTAGNGYAAALYNASAAATASGLAIKTSGTSGGNRILDLSTGSSANTAGTTIMTVSGNGRVGIGIADPSQAKLVISGSAVNTLTYGWLNSNGNTGSATATANYSIYATDRIAGIEFNAFSDERIKNIGGKTNNAADLQTLMNIEITDYTLKDVIAKGNKLYKKVIAQQVERVYPQAVSKMTDVVPDIYKQTEIKDGVIHLATALKAGDKVKLIFESGEEMATVTAATATSFTVDKKQSGKVFVFGKEVNDFRTVDYEALSTLNISATQELLKRIELLEKEIKELKQKTTHELVTKQ